MARSPHAKPINAWQVISAGLTIAVMVIGSLLGFIITNNRATLNALQHDVEALRSGQIEVRELNARQTSQLEELRRDLEYLRGQGRRER